jgi:hypothetical protein
MSYTIKIDLEKLSIQDAFKYALSFIQEHVKYMDESGLRNYIQGCVDLVFTEPKNQLPKLLYRRLTFLKILETPEPAFEDFTVDPPLKREITKDDLLKFVYDTIDNFDYGKASSQKKLREGKVRYRKYQKSRNAKA